MHNIKCSLKLRLSGVCPDADTNGQPAAHQFACSPDAQSGLKMRNVQQGPLSLRFSGVCPDAGAMVQRTANQFACTPDAQCATRAAFTAFQRGYPGCHSIRLTH
ncbi:MAG: hypothetical protein GYA22_07720 [Bacteroidales bacterium]|nr:hypothetical protein [Bacteroidales bacterium]